CDFKEIAKLPKVHCIRSLSRFAIIRMPKFYYRVQIGTASFAEVSKRGRKLSVPSYLVGVDIGGTFTDCVVIDEEGMVTSAKSPSTPGNFSQGMIDAVSYAAEKLGMEAGELFRQTTILSHGTTVGTNTVIQKRGARVGLLTTRRHNDIIHMMRGSRGLSGREM